MAYFFFVFRREAAKLNRIQFETTGARPKETVHGTPRVIRLQPMGRVGPLPTPSSFATGPRSDKSRSANNFAGNNGGRSERPGPRSSPPGSGTERFFGFPADQFSRVDGPMLLPKPNKFPIGDHTIRAGQPEHREEFVSQAILPGPSGATPGPRPALAVPPADGALARSMDSFHTGGAADYEDVLNDTANTSYENMDPVRLTPDQYCECYNMPGLSAVRATYLNCRNQLYGGVDEPKICSRCGKKIKD